MLRLAAVGAVDDGKSTLIGRLLHDTGQIPDDHLQAALAASKRRGMDHIDLSLLTDGLQAEREQGITIDVAHRYLTIPGHKLVIADCPGHLQYTRNMATGSSNADIALVVIDITRGIRQQTKRHMVIASLFGIRRFIIAVNKMDAVSFSDSDYNAIIDSLSELQHSLKRVNLELGEVIAIPLSALTGDNVVFRSNRTPWYAGPTLLAALQQVRPQGEVKLPLRLPIQSVMRIGSTSRRYIGMISSGRIVEGQEITILPSNVVTHVENIWDPSGHVSMAGPLTSISLELRDEVGITRGDVIVESSMIPRVTNHFEAILCWWDTRPAYPGNRYLLKFGTNTTRASIGKINTVLDVDNVQEITATELEHNAIGTSTIDTAASLPLDSYTTNRATGSFIVIDEKTNATLGAGMIR
jgi:bifunctional enzyme CysN/CysC